jgi:hypothetical protein
MATLPASKSDFGGTLLAKDLQAGKGGNEVSDGVRQFYFSSQIA